MKPLSFLLLLASACLIGSCGGIDDPAPPSAALFVDNKVRATANPAKVAVDLPMTLSFTGTPLLTGKGTLSFFCLPQVNQLVEREAVVYIDYPVRDTIISYPDTEYQMNHVEIPVEFTRGQPFRQNLVVRFSHPIPYHIVSRTALDSIYVPDCLCYTTVASEAGQVFLGFERGRQGWVPPTTSGELIISP